MQITPLGIPLGTRLIHVERCTSDVGRVRWRLWTALSSNALADPRKSGTFIELHDDGYACRVVDDGVDQDFNEIMPMIGE